MNTRSSKRVSTNKRRVLKKRKKVVNDDRYGRSYRSELVLDENLEENPRRRRSVLEMAVEMNDKMMDIPAYANAVAAGPGKRRRRKKKINARAHSMGVQEFERKKVIDDENDNYINGRNNVASVFGTKVKYGQKKRLSKKRSSIGVTVDNSTKENQRLKDRRTGRYSKPIEIPLNSERSKGKRLTKSAMKQKAPIPVEVGGVNRRTMPSHKKYRHTAMNNMDDYNDSGTFAPLPSTTNRKLRKKVLEQYSSEAREEETSLDAVADSTNIVTSRRMKRKMKKKLRTKVAPLPVAPPLPAQNKNVRKLRKKRITTENDEDNEMNDISGRASNQYEKRISVKKKRIRRGGMPSNSAPDTRDDDNEEEVDDEDWYQQQAIVSNNSRKRKSNTKDNVNDKRKSLKTKRKVKKRDNFIADRDLKINNYEVQPQPPKNISKRKSLKKDKRFPSATASNASKKTLIKTNDDYKYGRSSYSSSAKKTSIKVKPKRKKNTKIMLHLKRFQRQQEKDLLLGKKTKVLSKKNRMSTDDICAVASSLSSTEWSFIIWNILDEKASSSLCQQLYSWKDIIDFNNSYDQQQNSKVEYEGYEYYNDGYEDDGENDERLLINMNRQLSLIQHMLSDDEKRFHILEQRLQAHHFQLLVKYARIDVSDESDVNDDIKAGNDEYNNIDWNNEYDYELEEHFLLNRNKTTIDENKKYSMKKILLEKNRDYRYSNTRVSTYGKRRNIKNEVDSRYTRSSKKKKMASDVSIGSGSPLSKRAIQSKSVKKKKKKKKFFSAVKRMFGSSKHKEEDFRSNKYDDEYESEEEEDDEEQEEVDDEEYEVEDEVEEDENEYEEEEQVEDEYEYEEEEDEDDDEEYANARNQRRTENVAVNEEDEYEYETESASAENEYEEEVEEDDEEYEYEEEYESSG